MMPVRRIDKAVAVVFVPYEQDDGTITWAVSQDGQPETANEPKYRMYMDYLKTVLQMQEDVIQNSH